MPTENKPPKGAIFLLFGLECLLSLTIIFLCVGSLPPGINESHYLPKAKHFWDSSFASGNDIFLESNDSHFLASLIAGGLAKWLELSQVAWICRILAWLLFSFAWRRLCRSVEIPLLLRPMVLLSCLLLIRYGHLAGEWLVGGFEAKSIAYPLAMFGLAHVLDSRWNTAWVWLGAGTAFHPVVGGWVTLSAIVIWLLSSSNGQWKTECKGLGVAFVLALIGAWPALMGLGSPDREGPISAAQVHVYFRLTHHLCPRTFDAERWQAASFVVTGFAALALVSVLRLLKTSATSIYNSYANKARGVLSTPQGKLIGIATVSMLISFVGWSIDRVGVWTGREDLAAALLRFYWLRWSDVAVPLATTMLAGWWLGLLCFIPGGSAVKDVTPSGSISIIGALVLLGFLGFAHWRSESRHEVPPADRWMMQQPGPFPVSWKNVPNSTNPALPNRYTDWLAVCEWIKQNSPSDSLWITPKHQQSFKWYAERAEVVSWKDVPQDNRSIIEWYRRIERLTPPRDALGKIRSWETAELIALAKQYQCNWILIDRTYQDKPPLLECKYPINIDNRSFAVFYVSDGALKN